MKTLVLTILLSIGSFAMAQQPAEQKELAFIEGVNSDGMSPVVTVTVQYQLKCNQKYVDLIWQDVDSPVQNPRRIAVGVVVKKFKEFCLTHEPAFVVKHASVAIYSELPTEFYRLEKLKKK